MTRTAREANNAKSESVISAVEEVLGEAADDSEVALLGLAFKPNIDDLRESPAVEITRALAEWNCGTQFLVAEPNVKGHPRPMEGLDNLSLVSVDEEVSRAAIVVLFVDHDAFTMIDDPRKSGKLVVDTRGFWRALVATDP